MNRDNVSDGEFITGCGENIFRKIGSETVEEPILEGLFHVCLRNLKGKSLNIIVGMFGLGIL